MFVDEVLSAKIRFLLNDFDLIIFDQYHLRGILPQFYLKNVVEYVVNGGALLDASGPELIKPPPP